MNKLISAMFLIATFSAFAADGKPEAQYTVEVLDSFCIQNQDDFKSIIPMADAVGGKVLPNTQADPVMTELGGNTVFIPYEGRNYMVAFANGGGCTVITKDIDLLRLKGLLAKHFETVLIDKQVSLAQVNELYEVKAKGIYRGSIISIVYAQPETGYSEGSISFIPTATVKSATRK